MYELSVILRTCDRVNAFSGSRPRDFGTKKEVMLKCIKSLKDSIDYFESFGNKCVVTIVDDHSSQEMVQFLKSTLRGSFIGLKGSGNGESFGKCVDLAKNMQGLVFLIEDDYLLKKECLLSMVSTYYKLKKELGISVCLYPSDYPDRYRGTIHPSYVLLGDDRHYRSIKHTTCTFMYESNIFSEFEQQLKIFCDYGKVPGITEDNSINLVYNKYLCISPIPSLAEHYQYQETLSPFYRNL